MATTYTRARPSSETTLRAEALLARYPGLAEPELAELIDLFPRLSILDQAMMTGDAALSARLSAFHRDHGRTLKGSLASLVVLLAIPVALGAITAWFLLAS
jgi:hypothetical protein